MDPRIEIARKLLGQPEPPWFDLNEAVHMSLMQKLSDEEKFFGLALGAPGTVELGRRDALPVIVLARTSGLRDWEVNIARNTALIAVDLGDGSVRRRFAFQDRKQRAPANKPGSMVGPRPNKLDAESTSAGVYPLEARWLLGLPWLPGTYAITVTVYDWSSNTVVVRLKGPEKEIPVHEPFSLERARQIAVEAQAKPTELPHFVKTSANPEVKKEGVALSIPAEIAADAKTVPVFGTVKLKAPPGAVVKPPEIKGVAVPEPGLPAAVLRAMVTFERKDLPEPPRLSLEIPVFAKLPIKPGEVAEGHFAFDLLKSMEEALPPGEHQVYLIAGAHIDGPHRVIVHPPAQP
jgi:hypothetical protein